jgi:MFS family permease
MVVLDVTIVIIALPSAQADLGFDADSRPWVMTAYALAFGSLLPLGGKVSDLIGRKWTFTAGVAGFAAASALGGAASSFGALVGAGAMQGVFAALLAPAALLTMAPSFATATRDAGVASALVNASQQIGGSLGLALLSTLFADAVSGYTSAGGTSSPEHTPMPPCTDTRRRSGGRPESSPRARSRRCCSSNPPGRGARRRYEAS